MCDRVLIPACPPKHRLQLRHRLDMVLGSAEPERAHLGQLVSTGDGIAVDVGANWGGYTYPMSKVFRQVWAFEPNPHVTRDLEMASLDNVILVHKALSSSAGERVLRIPIVGGQPLSGWATLQSNALLQADAYAEMRIETARLDDYALENVRFIKIDAEGHEIEVLEGAARTIRESRPACLVEARAENHALITQFFRSLGVGYGPVSGARAAYLTPVNFLFAADA